MPVAAPNQTRLKILAGVLRLQKFTVADLCAHTGLLPSMVYRELSELQQDKVLEGKSAKGENAPRHRPRKWYELSPDTKVRAQLEAELASFLPEYEDPMANRHLKTAQEVLTRLSAEILSTSLRSLNDNQLNAWDADLRTRFDEAQAELRRATWESEVDFSEEGHSDHPIQTAIRTCDALRLRFGELMEKERKRRESEATREDYGEILTSVLRSVFPVQFPAVGIAVAPVGLENFALAISEIVYRHVKARMEKRRQVTREWERLLPFVSSLELDLKDVHSESELLAAVAKHAIAYGSSPDEPLAYIRKLVAESEDDYRLLFDEANLAQLAEQPEEARESWVRYLLKREPPQETKNVEPPVIARINATRWSGEAYEDAVRAITKECKAAVTAISETPFEYREEYVIEPQLYNPLPDKTGRGTVLIPIADALVQNKRLYIKTTEAERPLVLGLASLAIAGMFSIRIGKEDAWKLAKTVQPGERIVKVEFFRSATAAARSHAEEILTSALAAELVG